MDLKIIKDTIEYMDMMDLGKVLDFEKTFEENDYLAEAELILKRLQEGRGMRDAVTEAFAEKFKNAKLAPEQQEAHVQHMTAVLEEMQRLQQRMQIKPKLDGKPMDAETLNLLLWQADLLRTTCNLNEGMENEYEREAREIIELMAEGMEFREALEQSFNDWFWEGCLQEPSRQENLQQLLQAVDTLAKNQEISELNYQRKFAPVVFVD